MLMVSSPVPASMLSSPADAPLMESLPAPPTNMSLAVPPVIVSAPAPPVTLRALMAAAPLRFNVSSSAPMTVSATVPASNALASTVSAVLYAPKLITASAPANALVPLVLSPLSTMVSVSTPVMFENPTATPPCVVVVTFSLSAPKPPVMVVPGSAIAESLPLTTSATPAVLTTSSPAPNVTVVALV